MGIKRTVEWSLQCTPEEADARVRAAAEQLGMEADGPTGQVHARAKRSLMKNRWAAELQMTVAPSHSGATVTALVDMAGNKHFELLDELAGAVGDDLFADQGLAAAVDRLGKASRLFGRKEIRHLHNLLYADEQVRELGQGEYDGKQGLLVLTDQRLFFFEKSLGSERLEQFPLESITSMNTGKKITGETLTVYASGNAAEIKRMMHGHADGIARAFRAAKMEPTPRSAGTSDLGTDPIAQLERLAQLRDKGIVSESEFEAKKAEVMGRL